MFEIESWSMNTCEFVSFFMPLHFNYPSFLGGN